MAMKQPFHSAYVLPSVAIRRLQPTKLATKLATKILFPRPQPSTLNRSHDALDRRTLRVDDGAVTNAFGYNPRSELTAAAINTNLYGYAYDGIGNALWSTNNGVGTIFLTNPLNQYTNILRASAPPREFSPAYDLDGNMLTNGVWSYAWDGENRLAAVYSNSVLVVSNAYDHMSRRVLKVSHGCTETRRFVYDGWNLVAELTHTQTHTLTNGSIGTVV